MVDTAFPRDLLVIAAVFGVAAFAWAGMGHERPPRGGRWRALLIVLQAAGLALAVWSGITIARHPDAGTTLVSGSAALVWFIVVVWIEVALIVAASVIVLRTGRKHLLAPAILLVVGLHFVPLAAIFSQPLLIVAAVLLTAGALVGVQASRRAAGRAQEVAAPAPSFWCAVTAAPVFLVIGVIALVAGLGAVSAPV